MSDTPPPVQAESPADATPADGRPRVLVVDASELGGLLQALLARNAVDSVLVRSANAALDAILASAPELAIVDLDLPDASGTDLVHVLQQPPARVPVLVLASVPKAALPPNVQRSIEAADGFFQKPLHTRDLMNRVRTLLGMSDAARQMTPAAGVPIPAVPDEMSGVKGPAPDAFTPPHSDPGVEVEDVDLLGVDVIDEDRPSTPTPPPLPRDEPSEEPPADSDAPAPPAPATPDVTLEEPLPPRPEVAAEATTSPPAEPPVALPEPAVAAAAPEVEPPLPAPTLPAPAPHADLASLPPAAPEPGDPSALLALFAQKQSARGTVVRPRVPPEPPATRGSLAETPLHRLLDGFFGLQESGSIMLARGAARRRIGLQRGWITSASGNIATEQFGHVALQLGVVDVNTLARATEQAGGKPAQVPQLLMANGVLDKDAVRRVLLEQRQRVLRAAFSWADATYELAFGAAPPSSLPALFPGEVILRGLLGATSLVELRRRVLPTDIYEPRTDAIYPLGNLSLTADEARLVIACDGTKSVADLVTLSDLGEGQVLGVVHALAELRLVRPKAAAPTRSRSWSPF